MRYRLRTLLILLAVLPPMLAGAWAVSRGQTFSEITVLTGIVAAGIAPGAACNLSYWCSLLGPMNGTDVEHNILFVAEGLVAVTVAFGAGCAAGFASIFLNAPTSLDEDMRRSIVAFVTAVASVCLTAYVSAFWRLLHAH